MLPFVGSTCVSVSPPPPAGQYGTCRPRHAGPPSPVTSVTSAYRFWYDSPPSVDRRNTPMFVRLETGQSTKDRLPLVVGSNVMPGSPPKRIGSTIVAGVKLSVLSLTVLALALPTPEATGVAVRTTTLPA